MMDKRLKLVGIVAVTMLIIWFSIFVFYWLKADAITRDPCSYCSERMGKNVVCTTSDFIPVSRVYYPNGSVWTENSKVRLGRSPYDINFSLFEGTLNQTE